MDTTVNATYRNPSQPIFLRYGLRSFFFVIKELSRNATQQPIFSYSLIRIKERARRVYAYAYARVWEGMKKRWVAWVAI